MEVDNHFSISYFMMKHKIIYMMVYFLLIKTFFVRFGIFSFDLLSHCADYFHRNQSNSISSVFVRLVIKVWNFREMKRSIGGAPS